jgi:hypothetical protein
VVGKALGDPEAVFEDVDGADDEIHDRRRRVVNAAAFAHRRVVGLEVILVEIDERVALEQPVLLLVGGAHIAADRAALAERQIFVDRWQVQPVDDRQHFLDDPAHFAVFVLLKLSKEVNQFANQAKRSGHVLPGVRQCYRHRVGIEPGQKQAVGQHLGEGVSEFLERQFVKHLIAENLE